MHAQTLAGRAPDTVHPDHNQVPHAEVLNPLLADAFSLFYKTKNFHWHVSGAHFRDYHLLFEEQAQQLLAMTDPIAERVRKLGGTTLKSLAQVVAMSSVRPNEAEHVEALAMIAELMADNEAFVDVLRTAHSRCGRQGDVATASLIENWIDDAQGRTWFLREILDAAADRRP